MTSFRGANLAGADLRDTLIEPCDLTGADLTGARVDGRILTRCRLEAAKLDDVVLVDPFWQPLLDQIQILWRGAAAWNAFRAQETHEKRTELAGFAEIPWPVTSQSKSILIAARCCFFVGAEPGWLSM